jgi:hypothetical protein
MRIRSYRSFISSSYRPGKSFDNVRWSSAIFGLAAEQLGCQAHNAIQKSARCFPTDLWLAPRIRNFFSHSYVCGNAELYILDGFNVCSVVLFGSDASFRHRNNMLEKILTVAANQLNATTVRSSSWSCFADRCDTAHVGQVSRNTVALHTVVFAAANTNNRNLAKYVSPLWKEVIFFKLTQLTHC